MYGGTTNMEHVIYNYISHNCSHWSGNIKLKEKFGSHTRKIFNRFTTKKDIGLLRTNSTRSSAHFELFTEWETLYNAGSFWTVWRTEHPRTC
jgi:hypothetical protein